MYPGRYVYCIDMHTGMHTGMYTDMYTVVVFTFMFSVCLMSHRKTFDPFVN